MFEKQSKKTTRTKHFSYHTELIKISSGKQILNKLVLPATFDKLKRLVNQSEEHYQYYYYQTLERVAEWVQSLPSYKNKTYNNIGGFIDLAVTRAYVVMSKYRQQIPIHKYTPDKMPTKLSLWSYALFTASIFYNIGYIATNFYISTCNAHGRHAKHWNPIQNSMLKENSHFSFSFMNTNHDALASRYTLLFAKHLMPPEGISWIASDTEIMDYWLAILQDDERGSGFFATQIMTAEEHLLLQAPEILVSLDIPNREQMQELQDIDRLNKYLQSHSEDSTYLQSNDAHTIPVSNNPDAPNDLIQDIANKFEIWLRNGIKKNTFSISGPDSMLHILSNGELLLTSQIYQEFCKQNSQLGVTWQQIANAFKQMGMITQHLSHIQYKIAPKLSNQGEFLSLGSQTNTQGGDLVDPTRYFNQTNLPKINSNILVIEAIGVPPAPQSQPAQSVPQTNTTGK